MSNDLSNAHPGKWTAFAGKTSVGRVNQPEVESLQDWGTAHQGEVFNVMLKQHAINPLFVLDEVDKSNSDVKSDPLGPLYQLLEEETVKEFVDEFAGVPINASLITWLITANDESRIPAALLSSNNGLP